MLVPTYQAIKGALESVWWKPSIFWVVDRVRIMHPIQTENKSIRPISYEGKLSSLSIYTYLKDPMYQVRGAFHPQSLPHRA